jgi:septal ring factor EnvC (AmiA/AmiB activator)
MSARATSTAEAEYEAEIARLRERVAALEAQLVDTEAWANRVVVEAQDKTYWLDRWHIDLNALMKRRVAHRALSLARSARAVYRTGNSLRRQRLS